MGAIPKREIERVIPHRDPFLFVDEIVEYEPGRRAVGRYTPPADAWYFVGHFPGNPIVPGVLIAEAAAQVGAFVVLSEPANAGKLVFFGGMDGVRFRRVVRPGETLTLEVEMERMRPGAGKGRARAAVDGELCFEGGLTFVVR